MKKLRVANKRRLRIRSLKKTLFRSRSRNYICNVCDASVNLKLFMIADKFSTVCCCIEIKHY